MHCFSILGAVAGECSGHGECDHRTGQCSCSTAYAGDACSCRLNAAAINSGCNEELCLMRDEDCAPSSYCSVIPGRGWVNGLGKCVRLNGAGEGCWANGQCVTVRCDGFFKCQALESAGASCPSSAPSTIAACDAWCSALTAPPALKTRFESHFSSSDNRKCCECLLPTGSTTALACTEGRCTATQAPARASHAFFRSIPPTANAAESRGQHRP